MNENERLKKEVARFLDSVRLTLNSTLQEDERTQNGFSSLSYTIDSNSGYSTLGIETKVEVCLSNGDFLRLLLRKKKDENPSLDKASKSLEKMDSCL
jgi:hypothetical protein